MTIDFSMLAAAIFLLLLGHVFRARRWAMLFPRDSISRPSHLLVALSLGYLLNLFVPFRLSEIVRLVYIADRQKIRIAPVATSILLERLSDCVVLLVIGGGACLVWGGGGIVSYLPTLAGLVIAFAVLTTCVIKYRGFRHFVWRLTSPFNDAIRTGLIEITWCTSYALKTGAITNLRYVIQSLAMWCAYIASYWAIAQCLGVSMSEVMRLVFDTAVFASDVFAMPIREHGVLVGYMAVPLVVALLYATLRDRAGLVRTLGHIVRGRGAFSGLNQVAVPSGFKDFQSYSVFLRSLFDPADSVISHFGMRALDDGIINRIFHGGSGALTAQVQVNNDLIIRKFAIGNARLKLSNQSDWIRAHACSLPIVAVVNQQMDESWFYYDMPYSAGSRDFYEAVHSDPVPSSMKILDELISTMEEFHRSTRVEDASDETVLNYIDEKILKNVQLISSKIGNLIDLPEFSINGEKYSFAEWDFLKDRDWLLSQFRDRRMSTIHGDLTIENVITDRFTERGWFLIDPNPENVFNTPLIDWAKLFQSLHLGYEIMNRGVSCNIHGEDIRFFCPRTLAYQSLYEHVSQRFLSLYGAQGLREIHLHELVNYLRLTPYKFQYGIEPGLLFFANTCILIREFKKRYEPA